MPKEKNLSFKDPEDEVTITIRVKRKYKEKLKEFAREQYEGNLNLFTRNLYRKELKNSSVIDRVLVDEMSR